MNRQEMWWGAFLEIFHYHDTAQQAAMETDRLLMEYDLRFPTTGLTTNVNE